MDIYFAGSIRGGRDDVGLYSKIIQHLKTHGTVLTEHVGDSTLSVSGEDGIEDKFIHDRDMQWVLASNAVVAEVTNPSLGVGYEIGRAVEHSIPVLCLHRTPKEKNLSAMIAGCPQVTVLHYTTLDEAKEHIDSFLSSVE